VLRGRIPLCQQSESLLFLLYGLDRGVPHAVNVNVKTHGSSEQARKYHWARRQRRRQMSMDLQRARAIAAERNQQVVAGAGTVSGTATEPNNTSTDKSPSSFDSDPLLFHNVDPSLASLYSAANAVPATRKRAASEEDASGSASAS
jgi:hypothetical protein